MSEEKILVVDDEENILELIKYNLTQDGYQVSLASDGQQVLEKLKEGLPDLIILDIMLPGLDGFEICRLLQDKNLIQKVPIVFLSAKTEIENKVRGLELGATDYLTKPFSPRELTSRVRAIFRRLDLNNSVLKGSFIEYGRLTLDLEGYRVLIDEQEVEMTNKEFSLLTYLINKLGKACSRDELLAKIWGYETLSSIRTVDVHIRMLRKKFNNYDIKALTIETVRGVGYKLIYNREG